MRAGISDELLAEPIESATEQVQHSWNVVLCPPSGSQKDIDTRAKLWRTGVRANDVIERGS